MKKRSWIQAAATLLTNSHLAGFFSGSVFKGPSKRICVPGLNCYSCPGAVGSCPIGALQAVLGGRSRSFSYYVVGILLLFGTLFGRLICGFLCPFGFLQDLLYRIKTPKLTLPRAIDLPLRWLKYAVLAIPVFLLPIFLTDQYGQAAPYFCKWLCPAGTLEGAFPLMLKNESLRVMIGPIFGWKVFILLFVIAGAILLYRPFCKYLCPLGAVYGLLNRFSLYQMEVDATACTHCGVCERACHMNVAVTQNINSAECIRCGACKEACPHGAISSGFRIRASHGAPQQNE